MKLNTGRLGQLASFATWQLIGSIAGTIAGIVLVRRFGLEGSGYIAYYRNIVDTAVSIVIFGFPQALTYLMSSKGAPSGRLLYTAATLTILTSVFLYLVGVFASGTFPDRFEPNSMFWAIQAAIGIYILQIGRGLLLGKSLSVGYSLVSISTNVLFLIAILLMPTTNATSLWVAISVSWIVAGLAIAAFVIKQFADVKYSPRQLLVYLKCDLPELKAFGWWVWLHQMCTPAQILLSFQLLYQAGAELAVGQFATAVLIYNVLSGPIALVAPGLFRLWSGPEGRQFSHSEVPKLLLAGNLLMGLVLFCFILAGNSIVVAIFGPAMHGFALPVTAFVASAWIGYHIRVLVPLLHAHGDTRRLALGHIIRMVPIALSTPFVLNQGNQLDTANTLSFCWLGGEFLCIAYLWALLRQRFGFTLYTFLGR